VDCFRGYSIKTGNNEGKKLNKFQLSFFYGEFPTQLTEFGGDCGSPFYFWQINIRRRIQRLAAAEWSKSHGLYWIVF
jgi:hypothetical protein